jgi:DNA-binding transcriptional LysR family regulator
MNRRHITPRQLETFATVARLGSFSRAAETLHLTQPAVSIQIKQLSESMGLPLFEQIGREIRLTAAGEELQATVRALDDEWARLESAIGALQGLHSGRLRVALVTTAKYFLPRMLGVFCRHYPEIDVQLEITNRAGVVARMRGNEDDLYIMSLPPTDMDIVVRPFLDNPLVVIAPLGHPAAGQRCTLDTLATESFLLREPGSGSRAAIDRHLQKLEKALPVRLTVASNEAIRDLVASGLGLSILSRHALSADPASDGICILDVESFPIQQPWSIVHLKGKVLSLPAQAFIGELLQTAK